MQIGTLCQQQALLDIVEPLTLLLQSGAGVAESLGQVGQLRLVQPDLDLRFRLEYLSFLFSGLVAWSTYQLMIKLDREVTTSIIKAT